ncbi:methyl-accepting chemotaxis protein [Vibrio sp. 99-70-13A1]|uniref:methyl-accepting chemotaxis protein n=1 Tax=Vibrio sp. 99-70-13A1 TaxID=2607601 RepID=UPI0014933B9A|nr:methyl-accepting chemotaxis protein [Vibrio sp. 99-70-13A1]NOH98151.1 methyl-accepting chemotaxis protein [Vibrio sp. 99-70-13A1]
MFSNASIKKKLILPIVFMILVFAASSFFNVSSTWKQIELSNQFNLQLLPVQNDLNDAYRDLYQATAAMSGIALSRSNEELEHHLFEFDDNAYKAIPRMQKTMNLVEIMPNNHSSNVNELVDSTKLWLAEYDRLKALPRSEWANYYSNNLDLFDNHFIDVRKKLNIVKDALELKQTQLESEISDARNQGELILEGGVIFVILTGAGIIILLNTSVIKPIIELKSALTQIASGDGDLTQRMQVKSKDELGEVANAFNEFVTRIQSTVIQVISTSNTLRSEMVTLENLANNIAHATQNQQKDSELVASAVHEMQATSHSVSQNAAETAESSKSANSQIEITNASLNQTIDSISQLSSNVQSAGQVIDTLNTDVGQIASVLDVIRGIAEQTNLLALNAAIEAARAGEQGRGFAVVADEVRSLASRTQDSTGVIHSMIEKLQSGADKAVSVMRESELSSVQTIDKAGEARESLHSILSVIGEMNEKNTHIATASHQQSTVSDELNENIQGIADSSSSIVSIVQDAQSTLEELSGQCLRLDQLVSEFRT